MTVVGFFLYRGARVEVEDRRAVDLDAPRLALRCPICSRRYRLPGNVFRITVARGGRITISAVVERCRGYVICPNPDCGFRVQVSDGVAYDLEQPVTEITKERTFEARDRTERSVRLYTFASAGRRR